MQELLKIFENKGPSEIIAVLLFFILLSSLNAFMLYSVLPIVSTSRFGEHRLILLHTDQSLLSICFHGLTVLAVAFIQATHFAVFIDPNGI